MNSTFRRCVGMAAGAAGLVVVLGACAAGGTSTADGPSVARAQQVTVSAREY